MKATRTVFDVESCRWTELDQLEEAVSAERWRRYGDPVAVRSVPTVRLLHLLENRGLWPNAPELACVRAEVLRRCDQGKERA